MLCGLGASNVRRRVLMTNLPCAGWKLGIGCLLSAILVAFWSSFTNAQGINKLDEITDTITPTARTEYAEIISSFAADIQDSLIKFREVHGKLIFIRLEDRRFCIAESCVTIVTTKCGHAGCQYASVLVPPRYNIDVIGGSFWGELIHFPATQSSAFTTVVFNSRFLAAYHGI
jgi:hypothetical protein